MPPIKIKHSSKVIITSAWTVIEDDSKKKIDISFHGRESGFLTGLISEAQLYCIPLKISLDHLVQLMHRDKNEPFIDLTNLKI